MLVTSFLKFFFGCRAWTWGPPKGRIRDGEEVGCCPAQTWAAASRGSRWVGLRRAGWLWRRSEGPRRKMAVFSAAQRRGTAWDGCTQPGLPLGWAKAARMALAQK